MLLSGRSSLLLRRQLQRTCSWLFTVLSSVRFYTPQLCSTLLGSTPPSLRLRTALGTARDFLTDLQRSTHSVGDFSAPQPPAFTESTSPENPPQSEPMKQKIIWPKMSDTKAWADLDEDLNQILEVTSVGNVERKINMLTEITYNIAKERFGTVQSKEYTKVIEQSNRREREIQGLRKEIKSLNKRFKVSRAGEKEGIREITSSLRERLKKLRRTERIRKLRKLREKRRAQFTKDPYNFTRSLLGEARSGSLTSPKEEVEAFLKDTHSDPFTGLQLNINPEVGMAEPPTILCNTNEPTWKEVQGVVKKARAASAPGPSGIPYRVYKKCPKLLRRLWKLLKRVWKKGAVPPSWQKAEGCFVPKELGSDCINQFRTISLLSTECKIFFSVVAKRLSSYIVDNGYVNTSIQKGGIPGFEGCLEHTGVLSQMIYEAKQKKGDLTVVWLDLANAFGTIPHDVIRTALEHYHIPGLFKTMISTYLRGIKLRFKTKDYITQWQHLGRGIVTGCTVSPILFVMGMNLIIKAGEKETRGPKMESGVRQPALRGKKIILIELTVPWEEGLLIRLLNPIATPRRTMKTIKHETSTQIAVDGNNCARVDRPESASPYKNCAFTHDASRAVTASSPRASEQIRTEQNSTVQIELPKVMWKLRLFHFGLMLLAAFCLTTQERVRAEFGGLKERVRAEFGGLKERVRVEYGGLKERVRAESGGLKERVRMEYGGLKEGVRVESRGLKEGVRAESGGLKESEGQSLED
ncbi:hypothetical protein WMY93_015239 [Mugilogobius chulae]|uniref:Reverse transcriptase domain-containing protein n=1 Tax=Mugilogobius chulae TaxID=88201 RepID=A0AAW0NQM7_9GOBI